MAENIIEIIVRAKDEASKTLDDAGKSAEGLGNRFGGVLKVGAVAAVAGVVGLTAVLGKCAHDAADEEAGIMRLTMALKNQGVEYDTNKAKIEGVISAQQAKTGIGDGEQRESLAALVTMTGDLDKALELNQLAMDLSVAKQMDLVTAAEIVGKVSTGNTGILQRYGIVVEKDASSTEALAAMTKAFGGNAEAMGNTAQGTLSKIQAQLGDMMEDVGRAVLPLLGQVFGIVKSILDNIDLESITESVGKLAEALAPLVEFGGKLLGDVITPIADTFLPAIVSVLSPLIEGLGRILNWLEKTVGSGGTMLVLAATLLAVSGTVRTLALSAIPQLIGVISGALTTCLTLLCAHPIFAALAGAVLAIQVLSSMGVPGVTSPAEAIGKIGAQIQNFLNWLKHPGLLGYQQGGLIPEPTMLYGVRSQRFYGTAGEAGSEYIMPSGGILVPIYLDGREIARYVLDLVNREARAQGVY
jgi:hypothetical protein